MLERRTNLGTQSSPDQRSPISLCNFAPTPRCSLSFKSACPTRSGSSSVLTKKKRSRRSASFTTFARSATSFLSFQDAFSPASMPDPGLSASYGRWETFAESVLSASDHLSAVARMTRSQIERLEAVGISTMHALAAIHGAADTPSRREIFFSFPTASGAPAGYSQDKKQPLLSCRASRRPSEPRAWTRAAAARKLSSMFFSTWRAIRLLSAGSNTCSVSSFARTAMTTFKRFLGARRSRRESRLRGVSSIGLYARFERDPKMHIYHYAPYEVSALRRLMGKHAIART